VQVTGDEPGFSRSDHAELPAGRWMSSCRRRRSSLILLATLFDGKLDPRAELELN